MKKHLRGPWIYHIKRKLIRRHPWMMREYDARLCYYLSFQQIRKMRPTHDQPLCPLAAELHIRAFIHSTGGYNPSVACLAAAVSYVNREFCEEFTITSREVQQTLAYMTSWSKKESQS